MQLKDKVKTALDGSQMLVLVAQVVICFEMRAIFAPSFAELPTLSRNAKAVPSGLQIL
jgi:hypothetical protein